MSEFGELEHLGHFTGEKKVGGEGLNGGEHPAVVGGHRINVDGRVLDEHMEESGVTVSDSGG